MIDHMHEGRLLCIYTAQKLSKADWDVLRSTAISLSKPYSIKPSRGVQGSPGYILAIGDMPDFTCDGVAFVPNTASPHLRSAMNIVLEHQDDGSIIGIAEQLSKMIGGPVKELQSERIEQTVAFK